MVGEQLTIKRRKKANRKNLCLAVFILFLNWFGFLNKYITNRGSLINPCLEFKFQFAAIVSEVWAIVCVGF
jgi:hypothetical protein